MNDHRLAACLANAAGALLRSLRNEMGFTDPEALKDEGDRRANEYILRTLAKCRPGDAILSEESRDSRERLTADRVWIVDPLDGTREFAEPWRDDWAVHIALVENGNLSAGAVSLPALPLTVSTSDLPTRRPSGGRPIRLVVSRTRPPDITSAVQSALQAELVPMGSAGAKVMSVMSGRADVYVHAGGQFEWDSAAPVAVARAAGLHTSRIDGSELRYNAPDPWLPDLVVCRPELADSVLVACAAYSRMTQSA